jgi:hypothetical protein
MEPTKDSSILRKNLLIEQYLGTSEVKEKAINTHENTDRLHLAKDKLEQSGLFYFKYRTPDWMAFHADTNNRVSTQSETSLYEQVAACIKVHQMEKLMGVVAKKSLMISATFVGNSSLGYEHGKTYELKVHNELGIGIMREDDTGLCPYQSLPAFLRNWTNIIVDKKTL